MKARSAYTAQGDEGYVLIMVLAAILMISVVAASAVLAFTRAAGQIDQLRSTIDAERAMVGAEAETAFMFLTSPSVIGGIYTGSPETYRIDFEIAEFEVDRLDWTAELFWSAAGGRRLYSGNGTSIIVEYRDGAAVIPLNGAQLELIELLAPEFITSDQVEELHAKLADYTDADPIRRFRGAERGEYRLAGLPAPSDSPLRSVDELAGVLDWYEAVGSENWPHLVRHVTTRFVPGFKPDMAPATLIGASSSGRDRPWLNDALVNQSNVASSFARFTFTPLDGGVARIVEIQRATGGQGRPYRRRWIADLPDASPDLAGLADDADTVAIPVASAEAGR